MRTSQAIHQMAIRIFLLRLVETPALSSKESLQMCYRIGKLISAENLALGDTYISSNSQLPIDTSPYHAALGKHVPARPTICIAPEIAPKYCAKLIIGPTN